MSGLIVILVALGDGDELLEMVVKCRHHIRVEMLAAAGEDQGACLLIGMAAL